MFGRKEKPKRQNRPAGSLAQYGIFEVPDNFDDIGANFAGNDDDDDDDLEAELAALTASDDTAHSKRKAPRKPIPKENLDAMVAESMKDVIVDDEDVSDGEDDPELLNELKMITGNEIPMESSPETDVPAAEKPSEFERKKDAVPADEIIILLEERLVVYQKAEEKAKLQNDPSRARRYNRGIKALQELLHNAQLGRSISEADIPPPLAPSATAEINETTSESDNNIPIPESSIQSAITDDVPTSPLAAPVDQETLNILTSRQQEYKIAALKSKKSGNMKEAIQFMNIYKQFEKAIAAAKEGAVIDPSEVPPPPGSLVLAEDSNGRDEVPKEESEVQQSTSDTPSVEFSGTQDLESALKERLEVYRRTKTAAENEGNSSKARRYGRICKQFEDALKLHARGKTVPLDELPTPPGFPPLSIPQTSLAISPDTKPRTPAPSSPPQASEPEAESPKSSIVSPRPAPRVPPRASAGGTRKPNQKVTSRAEKQMIALQQRVHELKQAALAAKKDGDLELARDYLRQAKGIEPLIEASKSGLPVDMNSIPLSPLAKMELNAHGITAKAEDGGFMLVSSEDYSEEAHGTDEQIYENLESQLIKQIKWCLSTRDHCKALADVPGYNRWERLALGYTRDLDMLRVRKRDGLPSPQHHYETKTYAIVQSCTELSDSDIEISIIRGTNYPKEADTYVMWEFPYPTDSPPADRTSTIRGSCNPEYEAIFPLSGIIERTSRQCQRTFKRHALKCQVWAKGGFLRSDSLLGTVTVKLQPLETQCILHDSFPLMEGRKPTGGKLEVKIRMRNPMATKQIEQITDKWLTIDQ